MTTNKGNFKRVTGAYCVAFFKKSYKQLDVYRRSEALYVKNGSSFLRLRDHGKTSLHGLNYDEVSVPEGFKVDRQGFLSTRNGGE